MSTSNAERQRKYRQNRQTAGENGQRQLNLWVSTGTKLNIERLASYYSVTQAELFERLVSVEYEAVTKSLSDSDFELMLDKKLKFVTE